MSMNVSRFMHKLTKEGESVDRKKLRVHSADYVDRLFGFGAASSILQNLFADRIAQGYLMNTVCPRELCRWFFLCLSYGS